MQIWLCFIEPAYIEASLISKLLYSPYQMNNCCWPEAILKLQGNSATRYFGLVVAYWWIISICLLCRRGPGNLYKTKTHLNDWSVAGSQLIEAGFVFVLWSPFIDLIYLIDKDDGFWHWHRRLEMFKGLIANRLLSNVRKQRLAYSPVGCTG